ncbi:hypothetical protein BJV74DRAFT_852325 [Russula compacta]|nr:hypothetical protein BJV74DRAFT_852325 [Russula compacta]
MEEPTNDIDTETLQAQIDLSMAYAQNLVASWLPGSGSLTQSSSRGAVEAEAELQALLRRPSRLGVGAPLPETLTPAQTRLVQKLEGGKRRAREAENGAPVNNNNKREREREEEESDSAEESRVVAIRKRTRVDPFEAGGKKKKMKKVVVETAPAKDDDVSMGEAPQAGAMATVDAMTRPGQKKKKRKKKKPPPNGQGVQGRAALEGEPAGEAWCANHDAEVAQHAEPSGSVQSLLDEWDGLWRHQQNSISSSPGSSRSSVPPCVDAQPAMSCLSRKSPEMSPSTSQVQQPSTVSVPSALTASAPAILNLTGPPPIATEKIEGSHKKRRRKRKKKKLTGDHGADNDPP